MRDTNQPAQEQNLGEIVINLTKKDEPKDFKGKFSGKSFQLDLVDTALAEGTDDLKKPADWKDGSKLGVLLTKVKPFNELIKPLLDDATVTGNITALGDHTLTIKLKGNKNYSAALLLRDKEGKITRAAVDARAAHPTSVVLYGEDIATHERYQDTIDKVVDALKKPANWVRNNMAWNPELPVKNHGMPSDGYWKAYIDAADVGGGTKWRLKFEFDYEQARGIMTVTILAVDQDH